MRKILVLWMFVSAVMLQGCSGGGGATEEGGLVFSKAEAEAASAMTADLVLEDVARLSADEMEGRAPGTEGDRKARKYLAGRLEELGFEPGFGENGWEQPFSIVGVTTDVPEFMTFSDSDGSEISFKFWDEFMGVTGTQDAETSVENAELVFVGYGIEAPEENWDDFEGADLEGKMLLMLNDDPEWAPELFAGERKLFYGRWTYKYESAARQGAAGAIIIHTTPSAGYPWQVVQTSWNGVEFQVPAGDEPRLQFKGWLTEEKTKELVAFSGHDLEALVESARSREFRPVPLGVTTSIDLPADIQESETANVAGILRGSDPTLADEFVILSAHHDHLGIGEPDETGDTIYNGALDNGVAMAEALAVASAIVALPEAPRRSVMVLFVAGEEQGLLGSRYFAMNPTVPSGLIAADINFELGNIWGRTRDVTIFGKGKSTLEDLLIEAAEKQGRYVTEEKMLRAGWFYRSDQFSFARVGVPAIWFKSGTDFIGQPEGWGAARHAEWIDNNYHQPADELEDSWNLEGLIEDAQLAFNLALTVANADEKPIWYPGDEFEDERVAALAELEQ